MDNISPSSLAYKTTESSQSIKHQHNRHRAAPFFTFNDAQNGDNDLWFHAHGDDRSLYNQPQLFAKQVHRTIHVSKVFEYQLQ